MRGTRSGASLFAHAPATLAYNVAESVVALWFGVADDSVVLFGFGLDSTVEIAAAAAMLYRLQLEHRGAGAEQVERAEQRVGRFVGVTLLGMAAFVGWEAGLLCHAMFDWWWADPAAALLLVPWLVKEGVENVRGEDEDEDEDDADNDDE